MAAIIIRERWQDSQAADITPPVTQLLYFQPRNAFLLVRAHTALALAESAPVRARSYDERSRTDDSIVIGFNRFCCGLQHRLIARLCRWFRVPIIVDVDDLYWQLPAYSSDPCAQSPAVRDATDALVRMANCITTTTETLRDQLRKRFPHIEVEIAPNSPPRMAVPPGALLLANTDTVKLPDADIAWLAQSLQRAVCKELPLCLLGENQRLISLLPMEHVFVYPQIPYHEYLLLLHSGHFAAALLPVFQDTYADAKSDIKALEYLDASIPVIASDILPYRTLAASATALPLTVIPNTFEAWDAALQKVKQHAITRFHERPLSLEQSERSSLLTARDQAQLQGILTAIETAQQTAGSPTTTAWHQRLLIKLGIPLIRRLARWKMALVGYYWGG